MALLVQKYGGTSVGSVERIQAVAKRVARARLDGHDLVVVVSAMGHTTDELTALARALNPDPPQREMDMLLATGQQVSIALLSMALQAEGVAATSMTGPQVGIVTESAHGRARILEVRTERVKRRLHDGHVVVVAGFQGTSTGSAGTPEITTLGRGGSDTSAVALAAALGADACEIYTDVPGVLTTDPRKVPEAQLMTQVSCDEMLELASLGAAVLHPRAVEIARNYGVPLIVRSSWSDEPGTRLFSQPSRRIGSEGLELGKPVDRAELLEGQAVVALAHVPDEPGVAARLFEGLGAAGLNVDLIVQATHDGSSNDIAFTLADIRPSAPGEGRLSCRSPAGIMGPFRPAASASTWHDRPGSEGELPDSGEQSGLAKLSITADVQGVALGSWDRDLELPPMAASV